LRANSRVDNCAAAAAAAVAVVFRDGSQEKTASQLATNHVTKRERVKDDGEDGLRKIWNYVRLFLSNDGQQNLRQRDENINEYSDPQRAT